MLYLRCFGGLTLENGGSENTSGFQRARLALLAALAVARDRGISRDRLAILLWPDSDEDRARASLRQTLFALRKETGGTELILGTTELRLNPALLDSDVGEFARRLDEGQLERAVECYRGAFLDGFYLRNNAGFEHWLDTERSRLAASFARALESLGERARATADVQAAARWWKRRADHDPLSARVAIAYMDALVERGEPEHAIQHAAVYAALVRSELGAEPDGRIVQQVERLRARAAATNGHGRPQSVELAASIAPQVSGHATGHETSARPAPQTSARRSYRTRVATMVAAAALVLTVVALTWTRSTNRSSNDGGAWQFSVSLADSVRLRADLGGGTIALSPDASTLAYLGGAARPRIYLRAIGELNPHPVAGTEDAREPQFSPDGQWLAFRSRGTLKRLRLPDGPTSVIADSVGPYSWGDDNRIVFGRNPWSTGLFVVDAFGGTPRVLTTVDTSRGEIGHSWPHLLPGSRVALFQIHSSTMQTDELAAVSLVDKRLVRLGVVGCNPRFVRGDLIVFGRIGGSLFAAAFDPVKLRIVGAPVALRSDIEVKSGCATQLSIAPNGTAAYVPSEGARQLFLVRRDGSSSRVAVANGTYSTPRFSPNGNRVALTVSDGSRRDIFLLDLETRNLSRFTDNGSSTQPEWSRDGHRVIWRVSRPLTDDATIWWRAWDGSSPAESLGTVPRRAAGVIVFQAANGPAVITFDSAVGLPASPPASVRPVQARLSPNDKWVAYVFNRGQTRDVYVQRLWARASDAHQISLGGGTQPVWDASGRLYFKTGGKTVVTTITSAAPFQVANPDTLGEDTFWSANMGMTADYDVSRDGAELIVVKSIQHSVEPVIASGWLDRINDQMAAAGRGNRRAAHSLSTTQTSLVFRH
jgi:DNA-binding SARP family transcriptional activator